MVLEQKPARKQGAPNRCCHRTIPTASASSLTTTAWWPMIGLLLSATLAQHLGLRELVDHHLDLGGAPGRANTGDKMLTLVASVMAGGDFIDDADALRAGGTVSVLGSMGQGAIHPWAPSCAAFAGGMSVNSYRVSRQLLARAWAAGAGPGDSTLDHSTWSSTICETYGLAKEGARHHGLHRRVEGITRCWPLPPAPAMAADVPSARGPGQHRPRRRPLPP